MEQETQNRCKNPRKPYHHFLIKFAFNKILNRAGGSPENK